MNRSASPLLHDYKPTAPKNPAKSKALKWFGVGLGIPLLAVVMINLIDDDSPADVVAETATPGLSASTEAIVSDAPTAELSAAISPVEPEILESAEAIALAPAEPIYDRVTLTVRRGDTMDSLFRKNNLSIPDLLQIAKVDAAGREFRRVQVGDTFEILHDAGSIVSLYSELDLTSALKVSREDSGFSAEIVERPIEIRRRMAYGVIDTSLYESAAAAGLSDRVVMNIAGIFAWDIDFVLDIRRGDNYYVQYEEIWQDGEFVSDGEIVAAEFFNNGKTIQAIRFIDDDGRSQYFTPTGDSVRKAFLRAPVDFRVSSPFNPNRLHPVLNTVRPHRGIDYAAPHGTPIKATGDGKVVFRGTQRGYGNVVILQHGGNITTLYAHMSGFVRNVRVGTRVRQGQTIGYVGRTGMVTGVHLHYEYRLNGVHRNPATIELPDAAPIPDKYRERFLASVDPILEELKRFKNTRLASVPTTTQQ